MNKTSNRTAICPLFDFDIRPRVLVGHYTPDETTKYFRSAVDQIKQGFPLIDNVTIRRFTQLDFQKIKQWCDGIFGDYLTGLSQVRFVIEFSNLQEMDSPMVDDTIQNILLAMRLHKAIPVICIYFWFEEDSKINRLGVFRPEIKLPTVTSKAIAHVHLEVEDMPVVKQLFEAIQSADLTKRRPFQIVCERFNRSFEEPNEDEVLIDYCIAFEALFFKGTRTPPNVGRYIGLGCSMLLGINDQERDEIHDFLVKAYDVRNKIVHGSEVKIPIKVKGQEYDFHRFVLKLQNYLKESIKKLI